MVSPCPVVDMGRREPVPVAGEPPIQNDSESTVEQDPPDTTLLPGSPHEHHEHFVSPHIAEQQETEFLDSSDLPTNDYSCIVQREISGSSSLNDRGIDHSYPADTPSTLASNAEVPVSPPLPWALTSGHTQPRYDVGQVDAGCECADNDIRGLPKEVMSGVSSPVDPEVMPVSSKPASSPPSPTLPTRPVYAASQCDCSSYVSPGICGVQEADSNTVRMEVSVTPQRPAPSPAPASMTMPPGAPASMTTPSGGPFSISMPPVNMAVPSMDERLQASAASSTRSFPAGPPAWPLAHVEIGSNLHPLPHAAFTDQMLNMANARAMATSASGSCRLVASLPGSSHVPGGAATSPPPRSRPVMWSSPVAKAMPVASMSHTLPAVPARASSGRASPRTGVRSPFTQQRQMQPQPQLPPQPQHQPMVLQWPLQAAPQSLQVEPGRQSPSSLHSQISWHPAPAPQSHRGAIEWQEKADPPLPPPSNVPTASSPAAVPAEPDTPKPAEVVAEDPEKLAMAMERCSSARSQLARVAVTAVTAACAGWCGRIVEAADVTFAARAPHVLGPCGRFRGGANFLVNTHGLASTSSHLQCSAANEDGLAGSAQQVGRQMRIGRVCGGGEQRAAPPRQRAPWSIGKRDLANVLPLPSLLAAAFAAAMLVAASWANGVYFYTSRSTTSSTIVQGQQVETRWWNIITNIPDRYLQEETGQAPKPLDAPTLFEFNFDYDFSGIVDAIVDSKLFDFVLDSGVLNFMLGH